MADIASALKTTESELPPTIWRRFDRPFVQAAGVFNREHEGTGTRAFRSWSRS